MTTTFAKKAAPGGTGKASRSASSAWHFTIPRWLFSLPTTAACVISMSAPMAAVLAGLIEGCPR